MRHGRSSCVCELPLPCRMVPQALFWSHPVCKVAGLQLDRQPEMLCDDHHHHSDYSAALPHNHTKSHYHSAHHNHSMSHFHHNNDSKNYHSSYYNHPMSYFHATTYHHSSTGSLWKLQVSCRSKPQAQVPKNVVREESCMQFCRQQDMLPATHDDTPPDHHTIAYNNAMHNSHTMSYNHAVPYHHCSMSYYNAIPHLHTTMDYHRQHAMPHHYALQHDHAFPSALHNQSCAGGDKSCAGGANGRLFCATGECG